MKAIKLTFVGVLVFGGLLLAAASCEAWNFIGIGAGLAMLWLGALLSNLWNAEVCG